MRKFIVLLVMALLASCAPISRVQRGGDFRATRDSVYKIRVTLKLDLAPLNEWIAKKEEERKKREDAKKAEAERRAREEYCKKYACFGYPHPWTFLRGVPVRLSVAQEAMEFEVTKQSQDTAEVGWSGTGWIGANGPGRTYVMTAGHVCESKDVYPIDFFDVDWDAGTFEVVHLDLPIIEKHHVMLGRDGVTSPDGTILRDEDMDEDFDGNDLCMLGVTGDLGPAIPVAKHDPEYGQACSVVGAPTGLWGGGIAVASEALFAGRGSVFGTSPDGLSFNGLLAPGNSGSAVTCGGKAVGVISLGSSRFRSLVHAVPHERIRAFMAKALHRED